MADRIDINFLERLTEWRNSAQKIQFSLLKLVHDENMRSRIKSDCKINAIFQLTLGASFSLWRAVFITDGELKLEPALEKTITFLNKVVSDNAIAFGDEKSSKDWTAGFYAGHIQYRLYHLDLKYRDTLQVDSLMKFAEKWHPFEKPPGISDEKQFFKDAITCLEEIIEKVYVLVDQGNFKRS